MKEEFEEQLLEIKEKFAEYLKIRGMSETTRAKYPLELKHFFRWLHSEQPKVSSLAEITRDVLSSYQTHLYYVENTRHPGKSLSFSAQQSRLVVVRCFFRFLLKEGFILYDPASELELPPDRRRRTLPRDIMTKKEVLKVLEEPNMQDLLGIRDRAILEVLYATGIRNMELCNLLLYDIDFEGETLRVTQGKHAKDRVVPLGRMAGEFLRLYLEEARPKLSRLPEERHLFLSCRGRPMCREAVNDIVRRYARSSGIKKKITTHSFRHTCATHLLQGKAPIRHIQEMLGHRSLSTTQLYTRVDLTDLKKVFKRCHPREHDES